METWKDDDRSYGIKKYYILWWQTNAPIFDQFLKSEPMVNLLLSSPCWEDWQIVCLWIECRFYLFCYKNCWHSNICPKKGWYNVTLIIWWINENMNPFLTHVTLPGSISVMKTTLILWNWISKKNIVMHVHSSIQEPLTVSSVNKTKYNIPVKI